MSPDGDLYELEDEDDYMPNYYGLAEMLGFEPVEVKNFWDQ